jgi:hypothetical protein
MANMHTISIPEQVLLSAESLDELEDWLASRSDRFVEDMRRIRQAEDLAEKGTELTEIVKRWPIE